ncbi:MAG TPA: Trp family transcriptional regulator [Candidatus Dojkabacteria bacterium]|jgi:TrpR family trp operon transcriptional repressor
MGKLFKNLINQFLEIDNASDMEDFLKGILTPKEIDEIQVRLEIIRLIKKGVPQQKIASDLGIGIATVTRGSRELKLGRFKVVKGKK